MNELVQLIRDELGVGRLTIEVGPDHVEVEVAGLVGDGSIPASALHQVAGAIKAKYPHVKFVAGKVYLT